MTPDEALAEVRRRMNGRTRYEGQEPRADEVLAEEVERLRAALREAEAEAATYKAWWQELREGIAELHRAVVPRRALGEEALDGDG